MDNTTTDLLTDNFLEENSIPRNQLLPLWIRIFSWLFIVFGALAPVALIMGIISHNMALSLYGIDTNLPLSPTGLFLVSLFLFKAIVAMGFIRQTDWAINLGLADAISGIIICSAVMVYSLIAFNNLSLRLELVALIPYLLKLSKIKADWENGFKSK